MKIVSWNLGHQTQERRIKLRFVEAIEKLKPDVLALNEYVHGPTRSPMLDALGHIGLGHVEVSTRLNENNQILVASRHSLKCGDIGGPATHDQGGQSNFLHVQLPDHDLEVVGFRAPAYKEGPALHDYWTKLLQVIRANAGRRIVFIGDVNTDPDVPSRSTSRYLQTLKSEGWTLAAPRGAWSYVAGTRIDHALLSPGIQATAAEYVAEIGGIELASRNAKTRISDHAALVIETSFAASVP